MTQPARPQQSPPELATTLAGLSLPTPVITAAGCGGSGRELVPYLDLTSVGAFTTRTVTIDALPGSPGTRVVETPSGVLTNTGLQNPGLQGFLATELPWLAQQQVRTVVSIAASTLGEYAELARRVGNAPGVHAVEVDLAGPDHDGTPRPFDSDPHQAGKVLHVVRRDVPRGVAVLAKLSPAFGPVDVARSVVRNGADGLVVGHGFPGLVFDPATLTAGLGGGTGVVSGPAVLPQTLRCVWDVHAAMPEVPISAGGGVRTGFDALSMLLAGATAVEVGTAMLLDPAAPARITEELLEEIRRRDLPGVSELTGLAHHPTTRGDHDLR